jgi:hypothetical protein
MLTVPVEDWIVYQQIYLITLMSCKFVTTESIIWLLFNAKMAKAFRINVSKWTRLSKVLIPCQNPHCILDKCQLDSRNYTTVSLWLQKDYVVSVIFIILNVWKLKIPMG